jgi:hypothetical protein
MNKMLPLPDLDQATALTRLHGLPRLTSPFTLPPLDEKPQDPIFERMATSRQENDSEQAELRLSPTIFPVNTIRICEDAYQAASLVSSEELWLSAATSHNIDAIKARRSASNPHPLT